MCPLFGYLLFRSHLQLEYVLCSAFYEVKCSNEFNMKIKCESVFQNYWKVFFFFFFFFGRQLGKVHNSLYSAVCIFGVQDSVLISHGCFAMFSPSLLSRCLPFNPAANSNQFLFARPFPHQAGIVTGVPSSTHPLFLFPPLLDNCE